MCEVHFFISQKIIYFSWSDLFVVYTLNTEDRNEVLTLSHYYWVDTKTSVGIDLIGSFGSICRPLADGFNNPQRNLSVFALTTMWDHKLVFSLSQSQIKLIDINKDINYLVWIRLSYAIVVVVELFFSWFPVCFTFTFSGEVSFISFISCFCIFTFLAVSISIFPPSCLSACTFMFISFCVALIVFTCV